MEKGEKTSPVIILLLISSSSLFRAVDGRMRAFFFFFCYLLHAKSIIPTRRDRCSTTDGNRASVPATLFFRNRGKPRLGKLRHLFLFLVARSASLSDITAARGPALPYFRSVSRRADDATTRCIFHGGLFAPRRVIVGWQATRAHTHRNRSVRTFVYARTLSMCVCKIAYNWVCMSMCARARRSNREAKVAAVVVDDLLVITRPRVEGQGGERTQLYILAYTINIARDAARRQSARTARQDFTSLAPKRPRSVLKEKKTITILFALLRAFAQYITS